MLIDSHCHLDHLKLADYHTSLDAELATARAAGVTGFLCIGIDYAHFERLLEIEARHADVWLTIGEHPLACISHHPSTVAADASDLAGRSLSSRLDVVSATPSPSSGPGTPSDRCLDALATKGGEKCRLGDDLIGVDDRLMDFAAHERVVAVGETGLDYHYAPEQADVQRQSFIHHLQVAAALNKPVIVHSREAETDTLDLIRAHCGPARGVLHCFTGSWEMASAALDMGFYISISGIVTFANADELREVVKKIPLDRLLLETDSPWLAPVPHRGKPNTPVYLPEVARVVAELKGIDVSELGASTTANFFNLFSKISYVRP